MFGEMLYKRLPEIYKQKDKDAEIPNQLKNYLEILGVSYDDFYAYTQDLAFIYDIDKVDTSMLSSIVKYLGFKFPYNMTDLEKRNLIKLLPLLYENKGNERVFTYLGRLIFGNSCTVNVGRFLESFTFLSTDGYNLSDSLYLVAKPTKTILVNVEFEDELSNIDARVLKYNLFAEEFRPVNTVINFLFSTLHSDICTTTSEDFYQDNVSTSYLEALSSSIFVTYKDSLISMQDEDIEITSLIGYFDSLVSIQDELITTPLLIDYHDSISVTRTEDFTFSSVEIYQDEITTVQEEQPLGILNLGDEDILLCNSNFMLSSTFILSSANLVDTITYI